MYAGMPHLTIFRRLLDETPIPLVYNGNIFTVRDEERAEALFAGTSSPCRGFMLGRGLLSDPALAEKICAAAGSAAGISASGNRSGAACADAQGAGNMPSRTDARGAGNAASGGGAARNCGGCAASMIRFTTDIRSSIRAFTDNIPEKRSSSTG